MRARRGIALILVLLVTTVVIVLLTFAVNIGASQLRRATQELWEMQAQAGADGAVGWLRALIAQHQGNVQAALGDVAAAHSVYVLTIDSDTQISAAVSIHLATPGNPDDHLDVALQQNPYVNEAPLEVQVTASVLVDGNVVAMRSTTALVRVFADATPYSELVGFIDNSGPTGVESPGDPAGQAASAHATELRIHVYTQTAGGRPVSADSFGNQQWTDGNSPPSGALP